MPQLIWDKTINKAIPRCEWAALPPSSPCEDKECEDSLRAKLAEYGIKAHHATGIPKLKKMLEDAEKGGTP